MSERRVILDAAEFLDSEVSVSIQAASTTEIREIVQRYLAACYEDLGMAPRLLGADEMGSLLTEWLPRRFGTKDPLAAAVGEVLGVYLSYLDETVVVTAAYEQRCALDANLADFERVVASGAAHADGIAVTSKPSTVVHRADKTGRNDACPCGSGKKFKKCCMRLGS